ncbi:hypothetical protein ACJIZ3_020672 [Penstemon smallii]|uniref:Knottins-like domain-containing protein n=1 Tax=Penstemon smallii TaxID=265156 RepID=A0ABD3SJW8_9LAMI
MMSESVRMCKSRSREFKGRCFRKSRNCRIVCLHEGFEYGRCERGRCYCVKKCGGHKPPPRDPPPHEDPPGGVDPPPEEGGSNPPDDENGGNQQV